KAAELCSQEDNLCVRFIVLLQQIQISLRPVTSTVRTNPACLSPSTLSPNLQSLGPDCDSGAQFASQYPEMASVKLEDCSQTLELNVNIKDEEEEEKIGKSVSQGLFNSGPGGPKHLCFSSSPSNQGLIQTLDTR
ncbi:hypothetical protein J4Q44_G00051520, partial [Coregonus suidteri]